MCGDAQCEIFGQNLSNLWWCLSVFNCIELRKKMKVWNIIYLAILKILKLYILYTIWTSRPEYFLWNPTSSAPTSSISEFFRFLRSSWLHHLNFRIFGKFVRKKPCIFVWNTYNFCHIISDIIFTWRRWNI